MRSTRLRRPPAVATAQAATPAPPPVFVSDRAIIRLMSDDVAKANTTDAPNYRYLTFTHLANAGEPETGHAGLSHGVDETSQQPVDRIRSLCPGRDRSGSDGLPHRPAAARMAAGDVGRRGGGRSLCDSLQRFAVPGTAARSRHRGPLRPGRLVHLRGGPPAALLRHSRPAEGPRASCSTSSASTRRAISQSGGSSAPASSCPASPTTIASWNGTPSARAPIGNPTISAPMATERACSSSRLDHPARSATSRTQFGFVQDGGEIIFNLPNGFHAYYLTDGKGNRLDIGPTRIVRDPSQRDLGGDGRHLVHGLS